MALELFQIVEAKRITGGHTTGNSTSMTGVSTGKRSTGVGCAHQIFGVYMSFSDPASPNTRIGVSTGVSIVLRSGVSRTYDTPILAERLVGEEGFVFRPASPMVLPKGDCLLANVGETASWGALGRITIHIGY